MSPFVDEGYVDEGYFAETVGGTYVQGEHWTDFREYRRGRLPEDLTERWATGSGSRVEGAFVDLHHRNVLRLYMGLADRALITWNAPDSDTGHENQEQVITFRAVVDNVGNRVLCPVVRASGATGTESCYRIVFTATSWTLNQLVAGASTNLGSAVTFPMHLGGWYKVRLRISGVTLYAKVWAEGSDEPGAWESTVITDGTLIDGFLGMHLVSGGAPTGYADVRFWSVATDGGTAVSEEDERIAEPLDRWISEPDEDLEFTARVEFYNPATDSVESEWYSSIGRLTGPSDYPASTLMQPLLDPEGLGVLGHRLEADAHLAGNAFSNLGSLKFHNTPYAPGGSRPLAHWRGLSFFGRPVEIHVGKRWQSKPSPTSDGVRAPHRRFEIIGCGIPNTEPQVSTTEADIPLGTANRMLTDKLPVYRNVGIGTGVKAITSSGWLSIPSSTSYAIQSFNIYLRLYIPLAGAPGAGFATPTRRQTDSSHRQWHLALYQASHATLANRLHFISHNITGTAIISHITPARYNLGRFIDVILSVKGAERWYAYVDGMLVGSGALTSSPTTAPGAIVEVLAPDSSGLIVFDHRIESWVPEVDALARFSARRDADSINISMHRCDDNNLSTVTDYAPLANNGTLQGTDAVDRSWVPTYLGSAELAGAPMPISGGVLYHAPTQAIDSLRNIFRYNDRANTTGATVQVRAKGFVLTGGGSDYTTPSDGPGTVDIVGAVDEPLTYGLTVSGTPEDERIHVPRLVRDELISRGVFTPSNSDPDAFSALRQLLPFAGGFHYDDPPITSAFLSSLLGSIGAFYTVDTNARTSAGCMLNTINPGPYGQEGLLEFVGLDNGGVVFTIADRADEAASFTIGCIFKTFRTSKDKSAGLIRTMPKGQTLIDRLSADGSAGYYLGISGLDDGSLCFGQGGIASSTTGLYYLASPAGKIFPERWYLVLARNEQAPTNRRSIVLVDIAAGTTEVIAEEFCTSAHLAASAATIPMIIGGGPNGGLVGSACYVQMWNKVVSSVEALEQATSRAWINTATPSNLSFWVPMTEGAGEYCYELDDNINLGRIHGARWSPRLTFDFRTSAGATLPTVRGLLPAWRVEARYKENRTQLRGADIAATVSASDKLALGREYLSEGDTSLAIRGNYLGSRDIPVQTPLIFTEDADTVARMIRTRVATDRSIALVRNWYRELLRLRLTDEVLVYDDQEGFETGRPMRVAVLSTRLNALRGEAETWG